MTRQPRPPAPRRRPRKLTPAELVKRRLLKTMRSIDAVGKQLDDLQQLLKVPSPAQHERIDAGGRISMDALLLGVIYVAKFHLGEASHVIADHAGRYSRRTLAKGRRVIVAFDVLRGLRRIVRKHAGGDEFA
jgi:hypothetical protein